MTKIITDTPSYVVNSTAGISQENWDWPEHLAAGQIAMHQLFKTTALEASTNPADIPAAERLLDVNGMTFKDPLLEGRNISGEQLLNRRLFNDGLLVMHKGKLTHESYRNGFTTTDRHVIHSCTKSLCALIAFQAIESGKLNPQALATDYLPEFTQQGKPIAAWQGVTVQHVLDMQAGIQFSEDYQDPNAEYWDYARAAGYYPPLKGETAIGVRAWAIQNLRTRSHQPGTHFVYNSCLTNVLGMMLENLYQTPLIDLFESKLYQPCGCDSLGYFNTDAFGFPITEGQLNLTLRDFARCAYPIAHSGTTLNGHRLFAESFITESLTADRQSQTAYQAYETDPLFPSGQYKNKFWVLNPEAQQFTMLGIHGQFAWCDLQKELFIVGLGSFPKQDGPIMMTALDTLWQGIADHY